MATTPGISGARIFVGGTRKVYSEPAKWVEHVLGEIGQQGRERTDKVLFVPKMGWRLTDARTLGYLGFETGADAAHTITSPTKSALATYPDGSALRYKPNQRHLSELGIPLGTQTSQGDYVLSKFAQRLGGLGSDWTAFPPPSMPEPVPLDRCTVSVDDYDADDRLHFGFGVHGSGSRTIGPIWRGSFPSIPGRSKADGALYGVGKYALTCQGDGTAVMHELRNDGSWALRDSFSFCESSRALGNYHRITVESDAVNGGDGKLFGKVIRLSFSSLPGATGGFAQIADLSINVAESVSGKTGLLDSAHEYRVPNPSPVLPSVPRTKVRIDARRDCALTFQATLKVFEETGTLFCNTISLAQAPKDGKIHLQIFGHFPTGTNTEIYLYGAKTGTLCTAAGGVASTFTSQFADLNAIPGERSYVLNLVLTSSTDRLRSPTIKRVRYLREAVFTTVTEDETELTNVTSFSTTGCGADPSTETMGLVCYSQTDSENRPFRLQCGQRIRAEADLGPDPDAPDGPHLKSVLFRGIVREARKQRLTGKKKPGFNGHGTAGRFLDRYTVKAVSEWDWLSRRLAPGRFDFAYAGEADGLAKPTAFKITDAIRTLLLAILPPERVDVPDLPIPLPLDTDAPTFIEKFQPVLPMVMSFVRDYLGGYLVLDNNASRDADPTTEGMWRVKIAPKAPFKPVVEFCKDPIVSGISVVHPAAYPSATAIEGSGDTATSRPYPRTFLRYGSEDEWVEPPAANQIVVRGLGQAKSALQLGNGGALTAVLCNFKAAKFTVEGTGPQQGASGGPPDADPTHIDYTTGDVVTLEHSDPMLNTEAAVLWVARRLYDLRCHGKRWAAGEAPIVFVKKATTGDALQINPRPLRYADIALLKDDVTGDTKEYVVSESPSLLCEGKQGGVRFVHGYYALYSAPPTGSFDGQYRAAYGDNGS